MLRNNRFHSFGKRPDGRHPFDAEETQQNLGTSALNDPERKGLLELLARADCPAAGSAEKGISNVLLRGLAPSRDRCLFQPGRNAGLSDSYGSRR